MSITKVGSSYNFIYNTKTGKLSTKDGSKNEFVDFCNGDVKGEDTETLNHFDEHTRYQFTRMLFAYGTGMTGQNPFANDEKVEITADICIPSTRNARVGLHRTDHRRSTRARRMGTSVARPGSHR